MARSHWLDLGLEGCPVNGNGMAWHGVVWFHLLLCIALCYSGYTSHFLPLFLFSLVGLVGRRLNCMSEDRDEERGAVMGVNGPLGPAVWLAGLLARAYEKKHHSREGVDTEKREKTLDSPWRRMDRQTHVGSARDGGDSFPPLVTWRPRPIVATHTDRQIDT